MNVAFFCCAVNRRARDLPKLSALLPPCEVYLAARGALGFRETMGTGFGTPYSVTPLSADEIASWRAAGDELLPRLWQHLRHR